MNTTLSHYINAFSSLHTAKVKGHKAPHKAVLLLSVIDMVEERSVASPHIRLTDELVKRFHEVWHRYLGNSAVFTPDIAKPFFHMQHEPFWRLVEKSRSRPMMVAEDGASDMNGVKKELPKGRYSVSAMRDAFAYAEIDGALFRLLQNADARAMLRVILINTYLTNQPTKTMPNLNALLAALQLLALVA